MKGRPMELALAAQQLALLPPPRVERVELPDPSGLRAAAEDKSRATDPSATARGHVCRFDSGGGTTECYDMLVRYP